MIIIETGLIIIGSMIILINIYNNKLDKKIIKQNEELIKELSEGNKFFKDIF